MTKVFIGGSRNITRLPDELKTRLNAIMNHNHSVLLGDANGADKAVQKHLSEHAYAHVIIYCSGDTPRNNLGRWPVHNVTAQSKAKDYQFYAAKDREMAKAADFGLMVWDGESPGTLLNIVRLLAGGQKAVLYHLPKKEALNIKTAGQLRIFLNLCPPSIRADIEKRATPAERKFMINAPDQPNMLDDVPEQPENQGTQHIQESILNEINSALAVGDVQRIINALGELARTAGMSQVARETGLARESLYRSLDAAGNPEFATVMKVLTSLGISLQVRPAPEKETNYGR
jgi:probable addiction module antidote protein